jgi:hypothetical protein
MRRKLKGGKFGLLTGVLTVLFAMTVSRLAFASSAAGPLTQTEYLMNGSTPMLLVQLNGNSSVNYYVQQTSPGCSIPNISIDTVKIWVSLAQSAQLSGKTVTLYYTTCSSVNWITDVVVSN